MSVAGTVVSPAQQSTGSTANITSLLTLTAGNLEVTTVSLIQPKLTLTSLNGAAATITVKIRDITNGRTVYRESFAKDVAADTGLVVMLPPFLSEATTYGIQVLSSNSSDTAVSWQIDWLDVGIINANTTKIGGTTQTAGRDLGTVLPNAAAGATSGLPVLDANANLLAYLRGLSPNGVDTAIGAEGAAGRLAANLLAFFNSATQNLTGACVNQTADCNAAATWQRHARVANDCVGTVWYVATAANGGSDSNDGLTPWTPKLSPKTVIEAAAAGDLVLIGPGTFALGNAGIVEPDGVFVRGIDMDVTVLTSTKNTTAAIFKPGTNGGLSDLTIYGINTDWTYQRPLGLAAGQSPYTNAVGKRLHIIAYSDGYYATGDSATSMYLEDCWIEAKYDCVNCYSANQTLTIRNSVMTAIGPFGSSSDLNYARAIVADNGGIVRAYNCKMRAQDGGNIAGVATAYCGNTGSVVELYGCVLAASNTTQAGPVYSLRTTSHANSRLLASGCEYDRTATTGTGITDIPSHSVDSNGLTIQAAANAALAAYNTTGVAKESSSVALQNSVDSILVNTRATAFVPKLIERPDTGTQSYVIHLYLYDESGNMEAPDSAPSVALTNPAGTDRSGRLDSITMALVAAGHYKVTYTASPTDDAEQLLWVFTVVEGGLTRTYGGDSLVVDTTAVDFTATDRANLGYLLSRLGTPADGGTIAAKTDLIATDNADSPAAKTAQTNAATAATQATNAATDAAAIKSDYQQRGSAVTLPSTIAATGFTGAFPAAALVNVPKTGYSLTGTSGSVAPNALDADEDGHVTVSKNGTARLCKRVYLDGVAITQANISSIVYSIYLLDDDAPDARTAVVGHSEVTLSKADVIFDTLQTDSQYGNYNFRHIPPIGTYNAFSTAGLNYLVEYTITPTSGQKIITRFRVNVT